MVDVIIYEGYVYTMLYKKDQLLLIAGPCTLESEDISMKCAESLAAIADKEPKIQPVFKGSFDKANRTSIHSPRGPGIVEGLRLLQKVKDEFRLPVLSDIHLPEQAGPMAEVCDVIQIPAFLCRQTDLLVAAAKTGKIVNVKKGQFMSPFEMQYVVNKLEESSASEIWQTDRGTTFGYQNLIVDMRSFKIMKNYGHPALFDATHSVQLPGAADGTSGGKREFVPLLARAAVAAGADGIFVETHPEPENAISDAQSQIPLSELSSLIHSCVAVYEAVTSSNRC